eukprot:scaffold21407_cov112-Isochrysis_galbana.AAC.2
MPCGSRRKGEGERERDCPTGAGPRRAGSSRSRVGALGARTAGRVGRVCRRHMPHVAHRHRRT